MKNEKKILKLKFAQDPNSSPDSPCSCLQFTRLGIYHPYLQILKISNASSTSTPVNPRKCPSVLDEDIYVAAIEKIIERDFFSDIAKLRDRLDWLEAVKTGNPILIRDAHLKIIERR
ncbi:hypothetical protein MANES_16G064350v8 [Manihot esculenta]|uniref:Uncharacterized protein n=1 Tax=Manihot esculenta TaxID=3983 RepID=A0ACB7G7X5_MANES|nr:hypothetical protein MANES_16G064350v8 [Manihot esculenta]